MAALGRKKTKNDVPDPRRRRFLVLAALSGAGAAAAALGVKSLLPNGGVPDGDQTSKNQMGRRRSWVMLIDLRRCDGCGKCTDACQTEHGTPSGQEWIKVYRRVENGGMFFLPRPCMHCDNAPCLKVCPVGATYRSRDGLVLIDEDRCIGCRYCMAACPYDARHFNWGEPNPKVGHVDLTVATVRGHSSHKRGVVEKCMFCAHRIDDKRLPACVEGCPMQAIYFGDANEDFLSNGPEVIRLSRVLSTQQSFRFKEELGTEPRVYYLPVRR